MKKTSLQEQTSDPRWQRKRLEILERDKWTCKQCGDTETTLTVHHKSYRMVDGKFVDYWDYEGSELITLCDPCHGAEEKELLKLKTSLYYSVRDVFEEAMDINLFIRRLLNMRNDLGRLNDGDITLVLTSAIKGRGKENLYEKLKCVAEAEE